MAEYIVPTKDRGRVKVILQNPPADDAEVDRAIDEKLAKGEWTPLRRDDSTTTLGTILGKVTDVMARGLDIASGPDLPWQGESQAAQTIAGAIVPQNAMELGAMAATAGAGGIAAKAGLTGIKAAGARILGGTVGGEAGGQQQGAPLGLGAGFGAATTGAGEAIGSVVGIIKRGVKGGREAINLDDASKVAESIGDIVPALRGATTPADLVKLGMGRQGRHAIGDVYAAKIAETDRLIGGHQIDVPSLFPPKPAPAGPASPTLYGPTGQPIPITAPTPQLRPTLKSLGEVVEEIKRVGEKGYGGSKSNPLNRTITAREARELKATAIGEVEAELMRLNPTGEAVAAFTEGRRQYAAGIAFLDLLQPGNKPGKGLPDRVELNVNNLRSAFERNFAKFEERLTNDELTGVINVLYRGSGVGRRDIMAPGGGKMLDAFKQTFGRGAGGAPAYLGVPLRLGLPNVGSEYAGQLGVRGAPGAAVQTGLDLLLQKLGGAGLPLVVPE